MNPKAGQQLHTRGLRVPVFYSLPGNAAPYTSFVLDLTSASIGPHAKDLKGSNNNKLVVINDAVIGTGSQFQELLEGKSVTQSQHNKFYRKSGPIVVPEFNDVIITYRNPSDTVANINNAAVRDSNSNRVFGRITGSDIASLTVSLRVRSDTLIPGIPQESNSVIQTTDGSTPAHLTLWIPFFLEHKIQKWYFPLLQPVQDTAQTVSGGPPPTPSDSMQRLHTIEIPHSMSSSYVDQDGLQVNRVLDLGRDGSFRTFPEDLRNIAIIVNQLTYTSSEITGVQPYVSWISQIASDGLGKLTRSAGPDFARGLEGRTLNVDGTNYIVWAVESADVLYLYNSGINPAIGGSPSGDYLAPELSTMPAAGTIGLLEYDPESHYATTTPIYTAYTVTGANWTDYSNYNGPFIAIGDQVNDPNQGLGFHARIELDDLEWYNVDPTIVMGPPGTFAAWMNGLYINVGGMTRQIISVGGSGMVETNAVSPSFVTQFGYIQLEETQLITGPFALSVNGSNLYLHWSEESSNFQLDSDDYIASIFVKSS